MENFKNRNLTAEERAEDLLAHLSTGQKIGQLMCRMILGDTEQHLADYPNGVGEAIVSKPAKTPADVANNNHEVIDVIMKKTGGIPPVIHVEALTGLLSYGATSFPSAIGLACTFDSAAIEEMSTIIRKQMMAIGTRRALSPVMDVARDPRWGRIGETYGEDPTLAAAMSMAFVRGLQGENLTEGVAATGKHFLGYAMGEGGLNSGSATISSRDLREIYAKPFQAAMTESKLQTIMNSYGTLDNEPVIGSKQIMSDLLREEMKFDGVTVSDYGSIGHLVDKKLTADMKDAGVRAFRAGMEVECPTGTAYLQFEKALEEGKVSIEQIDDAVRHVLTVKFRLGLFENPYPQTDLLEEAFGNIANAEHSLKIARESTVLLKNDSILPLKKDIKKIAVIGPRGDSVRMQYGGYTLPSGLEMAMGSLLKDIGFSGGESDEYYPNSTVKRESEKVTGMVNAMFGALTPTVFGAIKAKCPNSEVVFEKGCDIAGDDRSGMEKAVEVAKDSDIVILAIGGKYGWGEPCTAGEGRDTSDIGLPGIQEELLRNLCDSNTPVIVVHGDARPLSSRYAKEHANAILETWCPGQTGGTAAADVIFGDYNPAGRLSVTALEHAGQVPMYAAQKRGNLLSMKQDEPGFNTFANGIQEPLWHFGEGLSYTQFEYSDLKTDAKTTAEGDIHVSVTIKNVGNLDGEEVVQFYFSDDLASMLRPIKELAGFSRVGLKAGQTKTVHFMMKTSQTAFLNEDMKWAVEQGSITLMVGASSQDIRSSATCNINTSANVEGYQRGFVAKAEIVE